MARQKPSVRLRTWGIYTPWDSGSRQLPKIREVTTRIPAEVDIEFGFIVNIRRAKNRQIGYCIDHPGIRDDEGQQRPPFTGSVYVETNDWDFFLGDTIWEPIADKLGIWKLSVELEGAVIAEKSFEVFAEVK